MIDDQPSAEEERLIQQGVVAFGDAHTPPRNYRPLRLVLRADNGRVIGGMLGSIVWDWLQIDVVWVADDARGRGHGRALLERAERHARDGGCRNARLDTFDFEARGFYEKLGYAVYGELSGFPSGHTQFHLRKSAYSGRRRITHSLQRTGRASRSL
jgi:GNAT superfamily N-acetyltransferase